MMLLKEVKPFDDKIVLIDKFAKWPKTMLYRLRGFPLGSEGPQNF
jgi:hypothetical protein